MLFLIYLTINNNLHIFFPGDNGYVREKPRQGTLSFNGVLDEPLPHSVTLIAHAIFEDTVVVTC